MPLYWSVVDWLFFQRRLVVLCGGAHSPPGQQAATTQIPLAGENLL